MFYYRGSFSKDKVGNETKKINQFSSSEIYHIWHSVDFLSETHSTSPLKFTNKKG